MDKVKELIVEAKAGHCIYCRYADIQYKGHEIGDGVLGGAVHYNCYCPECGRSFIEVYDMIYGGAIDDQGNDIESDWEYDEEL